MSENRGPLVRHPDRSGVWVRGDREEVFATPDTKRTEPLWHHVTVWTSVAVVGWLTFLVARAVMDVAVGVLGLGGSALAAAGVGAVAGLVGWAVERKP